MEGEGGGNNAIGVGHGEVLANTTVGLSPTAVKKITDQLDATV